MPYKIQGKCIYKKDTGKKVGCTKGDVKKYLAALHMHAENKKISSLSLSELFKEIKKENCCKSK